MLNLDIASFKSSFSPEYDALLGDDFFIAEITHEVGKSLLQYPFRLDAFVALFCENGEINIDINLNHYTLDGSNLIFSIPGNILRIHKDGLKIDSSSRVICIAISKSFLANIQMDFNRLFNESMRLLDHPCIRLEGDNLSICEDYFNLAAKIIKSDFGNKKEIIGTLISSVFQVLGAVWLDQITVARESHTSRNARSKMIFDHFLKLVSEYHTSERNVTFYAKRLNLTPKYLSRVVKDFSGQGAPQWIDSFVILEAKNMLKFSEDTIKEIVYKLNFPSQAVFYKFFKSHTGMTPSEYRKS